MTLIDDTLSAFKKRLEELDRQLAPLVSEADELREIIAKLEGGGGNKPARSGGGRPRGGTRRRTSTTRRPRRGQVREKILQAARENPQATSGQIAQLTGIARNTVATTMSKLRASGDLPRPKRS